MNKIPPEKITKITKNLLKTHKLDDLSKDTIEKILKRVQWNDKLQLKNDAGITFDLHSHFFLKKKLFIKLLLLPKLRFNFNIKKIKPYQRSCS